MKFTNASISTTNVHWVLGKSILTDGMEHVFSFAGSNGSMLWDMRKGRYLLDCFGQFASLPLGYNVINRKIESGEGSDFIKLREKLRLAAECKIVNSDLYSEEYASFVTDFKTTLPNEFKYLFFIEGGSPAVENMLKIAIDWKARKSGWTDEQAQDVDIIHLREAFHGRGGYSLSLTNTGEQKTKYFPKFKWTRVTNPKMGPAPITSPT